MTTSRHAGRGTAASPPLEVLLVEPWYGGSHRQWADGLATASHHRMCIVGLEDRHWRWRMRGGAVTLAERIAEHVTEHGRPDRLIVSSMVDVAALLGLTRRLVGDTPVIAYLHESQLLYPTSASGSAVEHEWTNWVGVLAADEVIFNSRFHRDALLEALPGLLASAPDHTHLPLLDRVRGRSSVLHVGLDLAPLTRGRRIPRSRPLVVWNHRWDPDKDPAAALEAICQVADGGAEFDVALVGENVRPRPLEFEQAAERLGSRVVAFGYLSRPDYEELLLSADVVVSSARQECFGISIVEAAAAGAVPIVPRRLSYPEIIPSWAHDRCLYDGGSAELALRLGEILADVDAVRAGLRGLREEMMAFSWETLATAYDDAIARAGSSSAGGAGSGGVPDGLVP